MTAALFAAMAIAAIVLAIVVMRELRRRFSTVGGDATIADPEPAEPSPAEAEPSPAEPSPAEPNRSPAEAEPSPAEPNPSPAEPPITQKPQPRKTKDIVKPRKTKDIVEPRKTKDLVKPPSAAPVKPRKTKDIVKPRKTKDLVKPPSAAPVKPRAGAPVAVVAGGAKAPPPFPVAPAGFREVPGNIMTMKSRGVEVYFHRLFGACIWELGYRGKRYTQPIWGRGGSFQTAMCMVPVGDSCERYNPTMAGAADDAGEVDRHSSVVKDFKLSADGTRAFVRTQMAYYYHAGTPVGSDPKKRPPINTKNLSGCFVSWLVSVDMVAGAPTLVIDVGIDVAETPPVGGAQIEVVTNYMPPDFVNIHRLEKGKLVNLGSLPDMIEGLSGPQDPKSPPPRPMAMATKDGKHCQGLVIRTRAPRGTHYTDYRFGRPPPGKEYPWPGETADKPRFGRRAYGGPLTKWTTTWHEAGNVKVSGKYAWRVHTPMGTVTEVQSALNALGV